MPRVKEPTPAEKKQVEVERKITAAVGNTNQEQIDRRNAIADRAEEVRAAEMQDTDGEKIIAPEATEEAAEAEAREAEAERARLEAEASETEARRLQEETTEDEPRRWKLRINGRDVEMDEAELIARASKVASADEYLQTAAEAVKRSTAPAPSQDVSVTDSDAISEDTLTSALQGDREAIKKLAQAVNRRPAVDLTAVDERLTFHDAVSWFRGEYADVVKDPFLYRLVVEQDSQIAKSEPSLSYRERLKKAGDTIRTWKQGFSKQSDVNPKLTRKASVAPVPAAGQRQSVREEEEAEEPVENVIDKMAKARGQGQAIRTPQGVFGKS